MARPLSQVNIMRDPWAHERVKKDRSSPIRHSSRSHPKPSSRNSSLLLVAGLGLGGYLLYSYFNKATASNKGDSGLTPAQSRDNAYSVPGLNTSVPGISFAPSTLQPGILTSTLTGIPALTSAQGSQVQGFWGTLSPVVPLASGYVTFPSGSQAAASLFGGNTAMDGNGNLYVQWAGQVFQLGAKDSAGNYPTQPVNV